MKNPVAKRLTSGLSSLQLAVFGWEVEGSTPGFGDSSFWLDHKFDLLPFLAILLVLSLLVGSLLVILIKNRKVGRALALRLSFETLLAELSARFIKLPVQEIDREIEVGLRRLAEFLGGERGHLWQFFKNPGKLLPTHSWLAPGIGPVARSALEEELPWIAQGLREGRLIAFSNLKELPPEAEADRQTLSSRGVKSKICLPLLVGGTFVGALTLDSCRGQKSWPFCHVQELQIIGEIFANALTRREAGEDLQEANQDYRIVADFTYDWEYWLHADGTLRYVSPACERISGYKPEEFIKRPDLLRELVVPEDRERWERHECEVREDPGPREIQVRIRRPDGTIRWLEHACRPVTGARGECLGVRASNRDISKRKQVELELQEALLSLEGLKAQLEADYGYLQEEIKLEHDFDHIVGKSDAIKYVLFNVEQVAPGDTTVLILGETGTGKELIARAIHHASPRGRRPLVKVDCAALTPSLIESELFGHEKGAFTGASARKVGRFELAHGSTIFLDEIGELPLALQGKLLRLLQDGEFERLGGTQTLKVDVRIIAATNRDLEEEVKAGRFREDLFYRLNVFPITLPPLRQRKADIFLLTQHFVKRFAKKMGKDIRKISPGVIEALSRYSWPGNIRELENVIERAVINTRGPYLQMGGKIPELAAVTAEPENRSLAELEREHIMQALREAEGRIEGKNGASAKLGLNPSTLRGRMRKLGISRGENYPYP